MRSVAVKVWLVALSPLICVAAPAQEPNQPESRPPWTRSDRWRAVRENALRLMRAARSLGDWQEHYGYLLDATERIFERSGWNSESDLFTLEMVREVGQIPPWRMQERYDKAMQMVADRYLLDERQMASLQQRVVQLNMDLFARHSDRIMQYALEAIETRAAGAPFTPEQVARWTALAEPVFIDARRTVNEAARDFMQELDPEQRELLERDLAAANRRMGDVERMAQKWKRGAWEPQDWGLEADPIQGQAMAGPAAPPQPGAGGGAGPGGEATGQPAPGVQQAPPADAARRRPAGGAPTADDEWARYVRAFIRKYHLNDEQQQRAWLIYKDAKERDETFERRFQRQSASLRGSDNAGPTEGDHAASQELSERRRRERERIFDQLKLRLERLPTRAQRRDAEPGEIEARETAPPATGEEPASP